MPDLFRGEPWSLVNFPPPDKEVFSAWINSAGNWETKIRESLATVMDHMRNSMGAAVFGVVGFCWGGSVAMRAAGLGAEAGIKATVSVHPAFLHEELAAEVKVPMLIMPSKTDPDHLPIKAILDKKPFGKECAYKRFDNMHHGFCAARGDWSVPEQAARATECIGMIERFMLIHVKG
ncbi:unnamed protein product [Choristocarpus tenellus]